MNQDYMDLLLLGQNEAVIGPFAPGEEDEPLPQASAPIASADPSFRPSPQQPQVRVVPQAQPQPPPAAPRAQAPQEQGFNFERAVAGLTGGASGIAAYDKARQERAEAPLRRKNQEEQLELTRMQREATVGDIKDKQADRVLKSQELRDAMDPNSELSKASAAEYAALNNARADMLAESNPKLADHFRQAAGRAAKQSRMQIGNTEKANSEIMGNFLKMLDMKAKQSLAEQGNDLRARGVKAQEMMAYNTIGDRREDNQLQRDRLDFDRNKAEQAAKGRTLKAQIKSIDKKAVEELQGIDTVEGMFGEAEKAMPDAYTGPLASAAVKVADGVEALTGIKKPKALQATQTVASNLENAVADMRKNRSGTSFTAGEQKAMDEWKPGVGMSAESNTALMSALRKYTNTRKQTRLQQVFKEAGIPVYLPPNTKMSDDDLKQLRAEFDGVNVYDDEAAGSTVDRINAITSKYGGSVNRGEGVKQGPSSASGAGKPAPHGQRVQQKGKWFVWDGSKYVKE